MGYLDNTTVEIDAILTKKGKELLSLGAANFNITQFALADDEIDYRLWNNEHNLGTSYYGEMIENLPIVETTANESQIMRYKLVTLPKNTTRIPIVDIGQTSVILRNGGQSYTIVPTTINYDNANTTYGYTTILSDSSIATIRPTPGYEVNNNPIGRTIDNETGSVTVIGKRFDIIAKSQHTADKSATITIIGNETGGSAFLNLTVTQNTVK